MKIDITMTCTLRPSILERTLVSFRANLFRKRDDYRLIVNIDPIGECGIEPLDIAFVCKKYFDRIIYNMPDKPSFGGAVKWLWSQVETELFFHLEDDWVLNQDIDIDHMMAIHAKYPTLANLMLSKYDINNSLRLNRIRATLDFSSEGFFVTENRGSQVALSPTMMKKKFTDKIYPLLQQDANPEKAIRATNPEIKDMLNDWQYGLYGDPGQKACIEDIGREWMKGTKFTKPIGFTEWSVKP